MNRGCVLLLCTAFGTLGCDAHWFAVARVVDPSGAPLGRTEGTYACPSSLSPTGWSTFSLRAEDSGKISRDEMHRFASECKVRFERPGFLPREVPITAFCRYSAGNESDCQNPPDIVLQPAPQ